MRMLRRAIGRLVATAVLSAALLLLGWGPGIQVAAACDCTIPSDDEALDASDAVFSGRLVERIEPEVLQSSADEVRYVFEVDLVHKGTVGVRAEVFSAWSGGSCGAAIDDSAPHVVFAREVDGRLVTTMCSGSRPLDASSAPVPFEGTAPTIQPEPGTRPERAAEVAGEEAAPAECIDGVSACPDDESVADRSVVAAAGAALAVAAFAATGLGLARRRRSSGTDPGPR